MIKLGSYAAMALVCVAVQAQPYMRAGTGLTGFSGERSAWRHAGLAMGVSGERGDVSLEVQRARRADAWDTRLFSDLYGTIGSIGYGNLRAVVTPSASVHPETDVAAGLYLNAGRGWEPSLQLRRMAFPGVEAIIVTAGAGRYHGARFSRMLVSAASAGGPLSLSISGSVRQFQSDVDFFEVVVSAGRDVTELPGGLRVTSQASLGVRLDRKAGGGSRVKPLLLVGRDGLLGTYVTAGFQLQVGG